MADEWAQYARKPDQPQQDEWAQFARRGGSGGSAPTRGGRSGGSSGSGQVDASGRTKLEGNIATDILGGAAEATVAGVKGTARLAGHAAQAMAGDVGPAAQDVGNAVQAQSDQWDKAKGAWKRGQQPGNPNSFADKVEAGGHALAASLPLVGPAAADVGETMGGEVAYDDPEHPDRATSLVRAPEVGRGIGQGGVLIASSSPQNITKPLASGTARILGKIPVPERLTPEGLYQSSLRPGLSRKNLPKIEAKVQTGLREEIPVGRGGLNESDAIVDDINTEIAGKISRKSQQLGPVVKPLDVTKPVNRLKQEYSPGGQFDQVNPNADLNAISATKREFLDKHSTNAPYTQVGPNPYGGNGMVPTGSGVVKTKQPFTLADAQKEKQGTYVQLRKKYGELGSADVEAQKALARGLKDEIAKRVPEISALNAREGALLELQTELERMVAREGNKNLLGLVPATMSHNPFGFLATLALDNPAIKSRIAILLHKARGLKAGQVGNAAAASGVAGIAAKATDDKNDIPQFARGGIIHKRTLGLVGEAGPELIMPVEKLQRTPQGRATLRSLPTPDAVERTSSKLTVPEKPESLKSQLNQLASGARRLVMFPKSTPLMKRPKGMGHYQDIDGNSYMFNPELTSQKEIDRAVQGNTLTELLGPTDGGMGVPDKSVMNADLNVIAKEKNGTPVQSAASDRKFLKRAIKQAKKITPKGGKVSVESPDKEIARRQSVNDR